ncbi:MAG: rod shape-determining protein [Lachnospiraceae bacterium]|nr:rod shape-determining protein [Lachnospiraceae bacterium]
MAGVKDSQGQLVFGLDIGTRSIVGTVGYMNNGKFHVMAQFAREHETRAMLDGQIHDIAKVGATISEVRKKLEELTGRKLTEVCIAAAGRVLRTVTTRVDEILEAEREITDEDVYALSTKGIEQAYEQFQKENDSELKFYCVGYTPMRYYMNGYQIANLVGHKTKNISCDLIATFLPDDVVDGLYKAVEKAGLHVANMTLEPIAAIQVAIPEKFRLLNMALVDVGAGTSDISITKDGTITAYGMIPVAGDYLTEVVVQNCLVDFETAEHIKRGAEKDDIIEFTDIMGLPQKIEPKKVVEFLDAAVEDMTDKVAKGIKELNGDKAVSAVFVVGGGGMVPGYTKKLAAKLGIMEERVAIRGEEVMQNIVFEFDNPNKTSLMVTPIGICLSYYEQSNNFIFVEFNGERLKLYDNGKLTIADAAMQLSFPNEDLFPKRGKAINYTVNGIAKIARGEQGEAAVITLNGDVSDMYKQITSGDIIKVEPSTAGAPATLELGNLDEFVSSLHVTVNGNTIELPKTADVNGNIENEFYKIKDGDNILVHNYYTVQEIAGILDVILGSNITVNGTPANRETKVFEGFTLDFNMDEAGISFSDLPEAEDGDIIKRPPGYEEEDEAGEASDDESVAGNDINVTNESSEAEISAGTGKFTNVSESPTPGIPVNMNVIVNGESLALTGKPSYVFVDVFDRINFNLKDSNGRAIVTNINGVHVSDYFTKLSPGDKIDIHWQEK